MFIKIKEKKNKRSGFTQRARWYQDGERVKIKLEDTEQSVSCYPKSIQAADHLWFMVTRQAMSEDGTAFISDLRKLAPPEFGFSI